MNRLIISDAGPLIIFARSGRLRIIQSLAKEIVITETVRRECVAGAGRPGAQAISPAVSSSAISVIDDPAIPDELIAIPMDAGEKTTIAYALKSGGEGQSLLMDEISGRRVARKLGLPLGG